MTSDSPNIGAAVKTYLESLPSEERPKSQQAVYGFVRWYGSGRFFGDLSASDVDNFAEQASQTTTGYAQNLELIRAFLVYGKKQGWSKTNLAVHLKPRKTKTKQIAPSRPEQPPVYLTQEGYDNLVAEIAELKKKRIAVIEDMRRAAADKDFRENAPLDAAREQKGHIDGRIQELEEMQKLAAIIDGKHMPSLKITVGDTVSLKDEESGEAVCYTIVSTREVDPVKGKISHHSPIGKAVMGRAQGDRVEIIAPLGRIKFLIVAIER
jgi:transcription elongation factor GreA